MAPLSRLFVKSALRCHPLAEEDAHKREIVLQKKKVRSLRKAALMNECLATLVQPLDRFVEIKCRWLPPENFTHMGTDLNVA